MQHVRIVKSIGLSALVAASLLLSSAQSFEPAPNVLRQAAGHTVAGGTGGIFASFAWTAEESRAGGPSGPGGAKNSAPNKKTACPDVVITFLGIPKQVVERYLTTKAGRSIHIEAAERAERRQGSPAWESSAVLNLAKSGLQNWLRQTTQPTRNLQTRC